MFEGIGIALVDLWRFSFALWWFLEDIFVEDFEGCCFEVCFVCGGILVGVCWRGGVLYVVGWLVGVVFIVFVG